MLRAQRPVPPLGIVLRTPVWDPSGYADEGRTFAKALAIGNRPLLLGEIRWSDQQCEVPAADAALFRALQRSRRARYVAAITECIPTLVQPDARASLNILRTTHETDRIPDGWLPHIQQYDEVWVFAQHNANAFRRSGVAPERMRVVNSCIDTSVYRPDGYALPLPAELANGFVFLSVFDWQLRKGWDLLLEAYCQEFAADDKVGLLLKISHVHGFTFDDVRHQADELLKQFGQSLADRPDIVMCNQTLSSIEVASLYRAVDAFVLPSRGEGWGRPYMEAMASGLPVIGTSASGNVDFMNESNSFLIPVQQVDVTEAAAAEIPPYRGHRWFEPDVEKLRKLMRRVVRQRRKAKRIGEKAAADIRARFDLSAGREAIETALAAAEERFVYVAPPPVRPDQSKVVWEGEFFASHSFSNINEQLALRLGSDEEMALSIDRRMYNPAFDRRVAHAHRLVRYFGRPLEGGPQVTVRHSFPPNLTPPASGAWIHIQPWEYGHLPVDWIGPLRDQVDEVWAPSNYVRTVYERSGFPREKIQVIPWGVDESVFRPDVPALILPTDKSFKFLFVGGTIPRKGIDVLLETYLTEFTPDDDVCLVIKDLGVETFYRYDHARDQIRAAMNDPSKARIVYIDRDMTPGQLASLYAACDCLAAPYRGEGFGLPILEAMACGVPAIVPRGGASDDFVSDETAFRVRSCEVETEHSWTLAGPCLELAIDLHELRQAMREAYEQRDKTAAKGQAASDFVREQFTWARTVAAMKERIRVVAATVKPARRVEPVAAPALPFDGQVALLVAVKNAERELAACLGRVKAFVDEIIVVDRGSKDSSAVIAEEYGARVIDGRKFRGKAEATKAGEEAVQSRWAFWLSPADILAEREARGLRDITRQQADSIAQVHVQLKASKVEAAQKNGGALRLFRRPKREVPVDSGPRYA
jgi:glycosyltransferase involved in cell wall biosynthesis